MVIRHIDAVLRESGDPRQPWPNMGGPNNEVLTPPPNRDVMLSVARTLVNGATDKIICTGPPEGEIMGLAHQMSAFVAPAARHTSMVLAFKKSWLTGRLGHLMLCK